MINYLVKILYINPAAISPTRLAEPSAVITLIKLPVTSPGRNAASAPKII